MFEYLYQMHEISLFAMLCAAAIALSITSVLLVHRYLPITLRYKENPVIGNMSALISIIYGVLAGLMALYLINNITDTSDAVLREADAVANIYRDSKWLKEPTRGQVHKELKRYLEHVINVEWPLMKQGIEVSHADDKYIDNISMILKTYKTTTNNDMLIMRDLIEEVKLLYNAREMRIAASSATLNTQIWIVILLGTVLTVLINYLFGMTLILHMITASAATLMAFSMVFLLMTLDRPFQGEFVLESDAFKPLLAFIQEDLKTQNTNST